MKRRMLIPLFTLSLLLSLVLWHAATEKNAAAAMQATYPLNPASFTSLGASPFASAGTYTINASKNNATPVLTKPDNTTINGVFFTSSGGEIAVFTFDSINIPANVTVQGLRNANSRPIALLSKGSITIDGIVDVSGENGAGGATPNGGAGGDAGPGGGGGGGGGANTDGLYGGGQAGARGTGGDGLVKGADGGIYIGGSGGGLGANGAGGGRCQQDDSGSGGGFGGFGGRSGVSGGSSYGDLAQKLQGGSGGGGGGTDGGGGGGGGGAVEIGAVSNIIIRGNVRANGGDGAGGGRAGGGGAGGGILIHGATVDFSNSVGLSARGGIGEIAGTVGGSGGGGRILVKANTITEGCVNVAGGAGASRGSAGSYVADGGTILPATNSLAFDKQPTSTTPNTAINPAITVQVLNACGGLTNSTATVTLMLNNANGATLSGNSVDAVAGVATFSNLKISKPGTGYTLTASSGNLPSATSNAFNITCQTITVTPATGALPAATVGTSYSQQFSQANGNGSITWSITPRSPSTKTPPGLSIDSTGKLSGTPTEAGSFSFTVTATDGSGCPGSTNYSLVVNCPTVTLPTQTLADGSYNSVYSNVTINPTGGTAPYTFTVSGLPTGMTRTPGAGSSGASLTLGGTPLQIGDFTIQVTVTDAYGCGSQSKNYALRINKATPVITWANPTDIVYGTALSNTQLNATTDVQGRFDYNPASGTVLNAGNGQMLSVSFTPNDLNNFVATSKMVTINVLKAPLTVTVNNVWRNQGAANPLFSGTITGLQNGDVITASYSTMATTSSPGGTYPITATLNDPNNRLGNYQVANNPGTLTVLATCSASISPLTLPTATFGQSYSAPLTVVALNSTVAGAYSFSHVAGQLPPGLSLVNTAGAWSLRGTPNTPGTYTFTLLATRNAGGCSRAITYTLTIPPSV